MCSCLCSCLLLMSRAWLKQSFDENAWLTMKLDISGKKAEVVGGGCNAFWLELLRKVLGVLVSLLLCFLLSSFLWLLVSSFLHFFGPSFVVFCEWKKWSVLLFEKGFISYHFRSLIFRIVHIFIWLFCCPLRLQPSCFCIDKYESAVLVHDLCLYYSDLGVPFLGHFVCFGFMQFLVTFNSLSELLFWFGAVSDLGQQKWIRLLCIRQKVRVEMFLTQKVTWDETHIYHCTWNHAALVARLRACPSMD